MSITLEEYAKKNRKGGGRRAAAASAEYLNTKATEEYLRSLQTPYTEESAINQFLVDATVRYVLAAAPPVKAEWLCKKLGVTEEEVKKVLTSSAFKRAYEERRVRVDQPMAKRARAEFTKILDTGVRIIGEKLNQPIDKIDDAFLMRAVELSSKVLRIAESAEEGDNASAAQHLDALRTRLLSLSAGNVTEGEFRHVEKDPRPARTDTL
jgi:hypothetical protein